MLRRHLFRDFRDEPTRFRPNVDGTWLKRVLVGLRARADHARSAADRQQQCSALGLPVVDAARPVGDPASDATAAGADIWCRYRHLHERSAT